jgi:uncharacterized protein
MVILCRSFQKKMKIVLAGGSGHVGAVLIRHFLARGDEVVVLSRKARVVDSVRYVEWDGVTLGEWAEEIDSSDVVINLAGRSVNCRYTPENLDEMFASRIDSTRILGEAIALCVVPPRVWLQSSTATIYAHRFDSANDEATGILGGDEVGVPELWGKSISIAKAWERVLWEAEVPGVRRVAMRSAMTMSVDKGSVFDVLSGLARRGLGGRLGSGKQYVSWIHESDFARAVQFLIDIEVDGAVNLCAPGPLPQADFARELREAWGVSFGLSAFEWMVELGCWAMRTESELVLKSRRVVPGRLEELGFRFDFPVWRDAAADLVRRMRG